MGLGASIVSRELSGGRILSSFYELAVLGEIDETVLGDLEKALRDMLHPFGLELGKEVAWSVCPKQFIPEQTNSAAAIFFGAPDVSPANVSDLLHKGIPILPVVSDIKKVHEEIPDVLRPINCLDYSVHGPERTATALLECVGLLPRQRRVFVSYRRDEAKQVALQLFDALSARLFDVFLDTHDIALGEDFQAMLWHRLCDSDVLIMLDTPTYFESRWTNAEFGRALSKGIAVLRVGWPDATPSPRTATASRVELLANEFDENTGFLSQQAIERICVQLETVRSQSHAIRNLNLVSNIRNAVTQIQGEVLGVGAHNAIFIRLPGEKEVIVYPTVGVPTSVTLHDASINSSKKSVAVVYDPVGLHSRWLGHLEWLGSEIHSVRWVKSFEAAWRFADCEA